MEIAHLERELRVQNWNDRAEDLWGDGGEVRGQRFLNLDIGLLVQQLRDYLRSAVAGTPTDEQRIEARDRRGRDIVCRVRTAPLADARGGVDGAIVMMEVEDGANRPASG